MTAVVDTNVVVYYILGSSPFAEEARQFLPRVTAAWAPFHWEAEFANAIWMAVAARVIAAEDGYKRLDMAARLGVHGVPVRALWQPALSRAIRSGVAVYDALFVELAAQRQLKLATFDQQLLKKFPHIAQRPRAFRSN